MINYFHGVNLQINDITNATFIGYFSVINFFFSNIQSYLVVKLPFHNSIGCVMRLTDALLKR